LLLGRRARAEAAKYAAIAAAALACFGLRHLAHVPQPTRLLEQGGPMALVRAYAFAFETMARLAVHPFDLCFFHTYVPPSGLACAVVVLLVAGAVVASLAWWRRAPSNPSRGGVAFGALTCACAMAPGALTAPTLRIIGDRYDYFPLLGAAIALAGLLEAVASRSSRAWLVPAGVLVLATLQLPRLESRLGELQSPDLMFRATLARDPDNFTTLLLWGDVLARRGDYAEAERVLVHARRVAPLVGDLDTALCFVHLRQRRYAEAEADGRRAVVEKPENPRAWLNLASALANQRKAAEAVEAATQALRVRPHYAEAHVVRAIALLDLHRIDEARADLVAAIAIDPRHRQARMLLARLER
jgi:tetratricopeptide (TPR) repeat protein